MPGIPIPSTMMALRLHPPGGVDGIRYETIPMPTLGEDDVLVRVHAAAITRDELNWPVDRLPATPSYELSGTVVDDPSHVLEPGQEVYGLTDFGRDGVAAEFAAVSRTELSPKPHSLSHVEAAAMPLPALSAMQGLFDHGRLAEKERVLIHGGGGGVGSYAVQLAKWRGAHVIATASSNRVDTARSLGADEVIDHTTSDFTTIDPVDLVFDTGGGERLERSLQVLEPGGRLVSVAETPPAALCEKAGVDCDFFVVAPSPDQLATLTRLADAGQIQTVVDESFPLSEAPRVFQRLQQHRGSGKLVFNLIDRRRA